MRQTGYGGSSAKRLEPLQPAPPDDTPQLIAIGGRDGESFTLRGKIMLYTQDSDEPLEIEELVIRHCQSSLYNYVFEGGITTANNDNQIVVKNGTLQVKGNRAEIEGTESVPVNVSMEPVDGYSTTLTVICRENVVRDDEREAASSTFSPMTTETDVGVQNIYGNGSSSGGPEWDGGSAPVYTPTPVTPSPTPTPEVTPGDNSTDRTDMNTGENAANTDPGKNEAEQTPAPTPTANRNDEILATQNEDSLFIQAPISFSATDAEKGWHVEEQVNSIQIRSAEREKLETIDLDQVITISGGVCIKQQAGSAELLVTDDKDDRLIIEVTERDSEHTAREGLCVDYTGRLGPVEQARSGFSPWLYGGSLLLALLLGVLAAALIFGRKNKRKLKSIDWEDEVIQEGRENEPYAPEKPSSTEMFGNVPKVLKISSGECQDIGRRSSQQDSKLVRDINGGKIAVVADGMGGLKNGDVVSRKIVETIDEACRSYGVEQFRGNLMAMVTRVNDEVNRMLGPNELYKCGSTVVAVLAEPNQFQWVSVGDSRIYLYRAGRLLQLNREHNFEADLLLRAVNHQVSFQEARGNPKRRSVSSFIGMGNLKYVDEAQRPTKSLKGDRILICSDGVYNTLPEQRIEAILEACPDPNIAADRLKNAVIQANNPHQDNFTAIIIAYE